jgi:hypothetical protein
LKPVLTSLVLDWKVEIDEFSEENTIMGPKKFRNLIATLDPDAEGRLVLACHIDSKITPGKRTYLMTSHKVGRFIISVAG